MNKQEIMALRQNIPFEEWLLDACEIAAIFGTSSSTLYRSILSDPDFPAPKKVPSGPKRWRAGDVKEYSGGLSQKTKC